MTQRRSQEDSPMRVVRTMAEGMSEISMEVHPSALPKREASCSIRRLSAPYSNSMAATRMTRAVILVCCSREIVGDPFALSYKIIVKNGLKYKKLRERS